MTGSRDPIEAWLSADVDPLPPSPGTFERIRRKARGRRAVRAAAAACGAAAVIAAAVVVPQVAGNLLPRGGGPDSISGSTAAQTGSPTPKYPTGQPSPGATIIRSQGPGPALASAGRTGPAAPGFMPTSVTFINGGTLGAVIGQARCRAGPCTAVAGTADYGRTWTRLGAPRAGPPDGSSGVSQIRFGDAMNGWAYGPALYATHNGGKSWQPVQLPGRVIDLSTVGGMAFAVVASCSGSGPDYAAGCTSFALYQTAAGSDSWQPVPGASAAGPAAPGGLQLTGQAGYLLAGGLLFAGPVTGGAWHRVGGRSAAAPRCLSSRSGGPGPALIAPAGELYLACDAAAARGSLGPGRLTLYYSANGGQTWQRSAPIPAHGMATSLTAIPGGTIVLATTTGIYYTADAAHWQRASLTSPAPPRGFSFAGMTTMAKGVAVPASSHAGVLFITRDGGRTWVPWRISR